MRKGIINTLLIISLSHEVLGFNKVYINLKANDPVNSKMLNTDYAMNRSHYVIKYFPYIFNGQMKNYPNIIVDYDKVNKLFDKLFENENSNYLYKYVRRKTYKKDKTRLIMFHDLSNRPAKEKFNSNKPLVNEDQNKIQMPQDNIENFNELNRRYKLKHYPTFDDLTKVNDNYKFFNSTEKNDSHDERKIKKMVKYEINKNTFMNISINNIIIKNNSNHSYPSNAVLYFTIVFNILFLIRTI